MDNVVRAIKDIGIEIKPEFKDHRFVSLIASGKNLIIGKYENVAFLISDKSFEISTLEKITVEMASSDSTFSEFRFGKYKVEGDVKTIKLECEFSEELFYDLFPALFVQFIKANTLLNDCNLQADTLSKEETRAIDKIVRLSHQATKSNDLSELERISFELSEIHVDFYRKFMRFKDAIEEMFSSMTKFETISVIMGGFLIEKSIEMRDQFERLKYYESKFEQTLVGGRDVFNIVNLRLDTLRNKENLELQKRTSSLQAAAAIIEYVAVFYYTLKIWEDFLPVDKMPGYLSFSLLVIFTTTVVAYTETLGGYIRTREISKKFMILTIMLFTTLLLMYILPNLFSRA
jgi:hypothetical protein